MVSASWASLETKAAKLLLPFGAGGALTDLLNAHTGCALGLEMLLEFLAGVAVKDGVGELLTHDDCSLVDVEFDKSDLISKLREINKPASDLLKYIVETDYQQGWEKWFNKYKKEDAGNIDLNDVAYLLDGYSEWKVNYLNNHEYTCSRIEY